MEKHVSGQVIPAKGKFSSGEAFISVVIHNIIHGLLTVKHQHKGKGHIQTVGNQQLEPNSLCSGLDINFWISDPSIQRFP